MSDEILFIEDLLESGITLSLPPDKTAEGDDVGFGVVDSAVVIFAPPLEDRIYRFALQIGLSLKVRSNG